MKAALLLLALALALALAAPRVARATEPDADADADAGGFCSGEDRYFCEATETCVPAGDNYCDCPGCPDEPVLPCVDGAYQCASGQCLFSNKESVECDGVEDCEDGSDERGCRDEDEACPDAVCPDGISRDPETHACSVCERFEGPPPFNRVRAASANTYGEFATAFRPSQATFRFTERETAAVCVELSADACEEGEVNGGEGPNPPGDDADADADDEDDVPRKLAASRPVSPLTESPDDAAALAKCAGRPAASAELWNDRLLNFGTISFVAQPEALSGVVSSVFTMHGINTADHPVSQIIVSFAGEQTDRLVTNIKYWPEGGDAPQDFGEYVRLPFRWNEGAHSYSVHWTPDAVEWRADGALLRRVTRANFPVPQTTGRVFAHSWGVAGGPVIEPFRNFTGPFSADSVRGEPHRFCLECFSFDDLLCADPDADAVDDAAAECDAPATAAEAERPEPSVHYDPQAQALYVRGDFGFAHGINMLAMVRDLDALVAAVCDDPFELVAAAAGEGPGPVDACLVRLDATGSTPWAGENAWTSTCPQFVIDFAEGEGGGEGGEVVGGRGVTDECTSSVMASVPFDVVLEQCQHVLGPEVEGNRASFSGHAVVIQVLGPDDGDDDDDDDSTTDGDDDVPPPPPPPPSLLSAGGRHASTMTGGSRPRCGTVDFEDSALFVDLDEVPYADAGDSGVRVHFRTRAAGADGWAETGAAYVAVPDHLGSTAGTTAFVPNDGREGTQAAAAAGTTMVTTQGGTSLLKKEYRLRFTKPVEKVQLDVYDFRADGGAKVGDTATLTLWSDSRWGTSDGARAVGQQVYTVDGSEPDGNAFTISAAAGVHVATGRSASLVFSRGDAGTAIDNVRVCDASRACGTLTFEEKVWEDASPIEGAVVTHGPVRVGVEFFVVDTGSGAVPAHEDRAFIARVDHRVQPKRSSFQHADGPLGSEAADASGRAFLNDEPASASSLAARDYVFNFNTPVTKVALDVLDYRGDGGSKAGDRATLTLYSGANATGEVLAEGHWEVPECYRTCVPDNNAVSVSAHAGSDARVKSATLVFSGAGDVGVGVDNIHVCRPAAAPVTVPPVPPPAAAEPVYGSSEGGECTSHFVYGALPFSFQIEVGVLEAVAAGAAGASAKAAAGGLSASAELASTGAGAALRLRLAGDAESVRFVGDDGAAASSSSMALVSSGDGEWVFEGASGQLRSRGIGSHYAFEVTRAGGETEVVQVGMTAKFQAGQNVQVVDRSSGASSSAGSSTATVALVAAAAALAVLAVGAALGPRVYRAVRRRRQLAEVRTDSARAHAAAAVRLETGSSASSLRAEGPEAVELNTSDLKAVQDVYAA